MNFVLSRQRAKMLMTMTTMRMKKMKLLRRFIITRNITKLI